MATETPDPLTLHLDLQTATLKCAERCLYHSAKWTAELLTSMVPLAPSSTPPRQTSIHPTSTSPDEARLECNEFSLYLLAKSYFDVHEFDRSSAVLSECTSKKSIFLHLYSRYIAGEKRRDEESEMILGPLDGAVTGNRELQGIASSLAVFFDNRDSNGLGEDDSWLLYLYGIVLAKQKNEDLARNIFVRCVNLYPYNWAAWQELGSTLGSLADLSGIITSLPNHIMTNLFVLHTNQELYQTSDTIHSQLMDLLAIFPTSAWLKTQQALLNYHARDFDEAESIFDSIIKADPHRIDSLDHYSNILYVMELRPKLGFIAQLANNTDKFRPETCCVIGNYYSLKSEHEKAVMYFRRALTLDRNFLSAWTLMGHEYVEMKNTHAAIESYRRAVDVNRKDYRAWYGLGLSYEVLEMHYYALFYFQRAAALRPYDQQMWQAMGSCFDRMNRPAEAIKAFKRALISNSSSSPSTAPTTPSGSSSFDPATLLQIGYMYEKMNAPKEAARWMEMCLKEEETTGVTSATSKARMWLAKWEFVNQNWSKANEYANELCQDGQEIEEAKALLRDLRSRTEMATAMAAAANVGKNTPSSASVGR